MFMTPEQLAALTDKKRAKDQIVWLSNRGYRFELSSIGRPKVLIAEIEAKMLSPEARKTTRKPAEPDFTALSTN